MVLSPDSDFFSYFNDPSAGSWPAAAASNPPEADRRFGTGGAVAVLPRRRFIFGCEIAKS